MKDSFINDCISLLKREDIKDNIKELINPIIQPIVTILLKEINPYIYLSLVFVFISFLLHLGIFILLVRNKSYF
tara:strand:- start:273 stop:494 length:222 start_codon:yes stop_codon:yes gene_type:complete